MSREISQAFLGNFDPIKEEISQSTELDEDYSLPNLNPSQNDALNHALKNPLTIIQGNGMNILIFKIKKKFFFNI